MHNLTGNIIGYINWKICRGTLPDTKEISECTYINDSNNLSRSANINFVGGYCIDDPESCMQSNESNGGSEDRNITGSQMPITNETGSMDRLINLISDMGQSHSSRNYNDDGNIFLLYNFSSY